MKKATKTANKIEKNKSKVKNNAKTAIVFKI